jgi:hypothetical protein
VLRLREDGTVKLPDHRREEIVDAYQMIRGMTDLPRGRRFCQIAARYTFRTSGPACGRAGIVHSMQTLGLFPSGAGRASPAAGVDPVPR